MAHRLPVLLVLAATATLLVPACSSDDPPTVLVVGDSVTDLSRQELGQDFGWADELIVRAQAGATTEELLPLAEDGASHDPDIAVFLPGYNDILEQQADTGALDEMVALAADVPCAVWLLLPADGGYDPAQVEAWNARIEQAAEEHPSIHVASDWKELVENSPDFTFLSRRDAIHPNKDGQRAIASVMSDQAKDRCT